MPETALNSRFADLKMAKTPLRGRFADLGMAKTPVCGRFADLEMAKTPVCGRFADLKTQKTPPERRSGDLEMAETPVFRSGERPEAADGGVFRALEGAGFGVADEGDVARLLPTGELRGGVEERDGGDLLQAEAVFAEVALEEAVLAQSEDVAAGGADRVEFTRGKERRPGRRAAVRRDGAERAR